MAAEVGVADVGPIHRWFLARGKVLNLDRPAVMAILNLTPDSFHAGGRLSDPGAAAAAGAEAVAAGAVMLDLGGESTRPGAEPVAAPDQVRRVVPAIRAIRGAGGLAADIPISVDTTSAAVAAAALDAGADAVNDVSAGLDDSGMLPLVAARRAGVVLMHRLAPPRGDSYSDRYEREPGYADVVGEVKEFLRTRLVAAESAGIARDAVLLDPGLGFGKSVDQNLELIRRTGEIAALGRPVLSGLSRKSFVGRASLGRDSTTAERLAGTLALSVAHLLAGARVFRVHDVREHAAALRAADAIGHPGGVG